jgi:hypothetical protein
MADSKPFAVVVVAAISFVERICELDPIDRIEDGASR